MLNFCVRLSLVNDFGVLVICRIVLELYASVLYASVNADSFPIRCAVLETHVFLPTPTFLFYPNSA